ncbi:MAG: class I mannose-6-phosphate isomerase [Planctomycetota bacterium]|nr:class I mannose-6-phosphate isomerase [Planctomycetota bacterium]
MREPPFLQLTPRAVLRPWGGSRVARRFGWDAGSAVGEWWLASCYPGMETALHETAGNLATWLETEGRALNCPEAIDFPILLKFLDAEETLSLQVHPNDDVAARHGLPGGKTEAWHILDADANACVYLGTAPGTTCAEIMSRIEAGASNEDVLSMMNRLAVRAGDTLFVKAGTLHAIAGGVSLFEVQQNSDATYRMHDWGRGRALHLEQARDAMIDGPPSQIIRPEVGQDWTTLVDCSAFQLSRAKPNAPIKIAPTDGYALLTLLAGTGELQGKQGTQATLSAGDTLLVLDEVELAGADLDLLLVQPGL